MIQYRFIVSFLLFFALACKDAAKDSPVVEDNINAATDFIRAALDGKFQVAKKYMLADSVNLNYLEIAERSFAKTDQQTRNGYRVSSINIHEVNEVVNDSVTLVIFSNSFKNDHDTLKVLKQNDKWLVDLKYLYDHDMDTSLNRYIKKDTLQ